MPIIRATAEIARAAMTVAARVVRAPNAVARHLPAPAAIAVAQGHAAPAQDLVAPTARREIAPEARAPVEIAAPVDAGMIVATTVATMIDRHAKHRAPLLPV